MILITHSVFASILFLLVDSESPQVGSSVEFSCYGPAIQQRGVSFFENGGKLAWKADGNIIALSSMVQDDVFVHNVIVSEKSDRYSVNENTQRTQTGDSVYFSLQIDNVSVDDNKAYSCALLSAQNDIEIESSIETLKVQFPPNQLHPLCSVDSIQNDSKYATLKCRSETAFPPVRLNWTSTVGHLSNERYSESESFIESDVDISIPSKDH